MSPILCCGSEDFCVLGVHRLGNNLGKVFWRVLLRFSFGVDRIPVFFGLAHRNQISSQRKKKKKRMSTMFLPH